MLSRLDPHQLPRSGNCSARRWHHREWLDFSDVETHPVGELVGGIVPILVERWLQVFSMNVKSEQPELTVDKALAAKSRKRIGSYRVIAPRIVQTQTWQGSLSLWKQVAALELE